MKKKYRVTLTEEERGMLKTLVSTGKAAARKITHAGILLPADEDSEEGRQIDASIVKALQVSRSTVERLYCVPNHVAPKGSAPSTRL